jgi:hypothetical protein
MGIADDLIRKVKAGSTQSDSLGKELATKRDMVAQGRKALDGDPVASAPASVKAPSTYDSGKRYGDRPGEKRIDVREAMRPLGSFKTGTDYVPKTGMYKLHEGEAVKTKEENVMDAKTAMEGITGKSQKPPKKIREIHTKQTDDGKYIHTHLHHHPSHHPEETHVSNDLAGMADHMSAQAPNMTSQPPAMPEAGAPAAAPQPGM